MPPWGSLRRQRGEKLDVDAARGKLAGVDVVNDTVARRFVSGLPPSLLPVATMSSSIVQAPCAEHRHTDIFLGSFATTKAPSLRRAISSRIDDIKPTQRALRCTERHCTPKPHFFPRCPSETLSRVHGEASEVCTAPSGRRTHMTSLPRCWWHGMPCTVRVPPVLWPLGVAGRHCHSEESSFTWRRATSARLQGPLLRWGVSRSRATRHPPTIRLYCTFVSATLRRS